MAYTLENILFLIFLTTVVLENKLNLGYVISSNNISTHRTRGLVKFPKFRTDERAVMNIKERRCSRRKVRQQHKKFIEICA